MGAGWCAQCRCSAFFSLYFPFWVQYTIYVHYTSYFLVLSILASIISASMWILFLMDKGRHCSTLPCLQQLREQRGSAFAIYTSGYCSSGSWIPLSSFPWETITTIFRDRYLCKKTVQTIFSSILLSLKFVKKAAGNTPW